MINIVDFTNNGNKLNSSVHFLELLDDIHKIILAVNRFCINSVYLLFQDYFLRLMCEGIKQGRCPRSQNKQAKKKKKKKKNARCRF